jgi:hypothetical protein
MAKNLVSTQMIQRFSFLLLLTLFSFEQRERELFTIPSNVRPWPDVVKLFTAVIYETNDSNKFYDTAPGRFGQVFVVVCGCTLARCCKTFSGCNYE